MTPTPQQLKKMMEDQWNKPGCDTPLQIARWIITSTDLESYQGVFRDEDDQSGTEPRSPGAG